MWMTRITRHHDRLDQAVVTLVLTDPAELEILSGLLGSKIEIKRVPQTDAEPVEEPK
jgi:hypothetical protein